MSILAQARKGTGVMRYARAVWRALLSIRMPVIRPIARFLYAERELRGILWPLFLKIIYREPLMRYRCAVVGERLNLEGAIPLIYGDGRIEIGDDVRIGGKNTWVVGYKNSTNPELIIGNRVNVGYRNQITAAVSIRIGDDTIIAPDVQIYDNATHPLSPAARLRHEPVHPSDCAPVVIGRNCWLGTGAIIMRGVTIGDGSVVAAASVVTKSVPPATLVAGNPAREIRSIAD